METRTLKQRRREDAEVDTESKAIFHVISTTLATAPTDRPTDRPWWNSTRPLRVWVRIECVRPCPFRSFRGKARGRHSKCPIAKSKNRRKRKNQSSRSCRTAERRDRHVILLRNTCSATKTRKPRETPSKTAQTTLGSRAAASSKVPRGSSSGARLKKLGLDFNQRGASIWASSPSSDSPWEASSWKQSPRSLGINIVVRLDKTDVWKNLSRPSCRALLLRGVS